MFRRREFRCLPLSLASSCSWVPASFEFFFVFCFFYRSSLGLHCRSSTEILPHNWGTFCAEVCPMCVFPFAGDGTRTPTTAVSTWCTGALTTSANPTSSEPVTACATASPNQRKGKQRVVILLKETRKGKYENSKYCKNLLIEVYPKQYWLSI